MKTQHNVQLKGSFRSAGNEVIEANTHQANLVTFFKDSSNYFTVHLVEDSNKHVLLHTPKGEYLLEWNTAGFFGGVANNTKVHITLKKTIGKLMYWM